MIALLAQADPERAKKMAEEIVHKEPTSMPSFTGESMEQYKQWLQNIQDSAIPTPDQTIGSLQGFGMFQMVLFCALGAMFLILGWKWFRVLVPFAMAQLGGLIAASVAIGLDLAMWWWFVCLGLGFLLTLLLAIRLIQGFIVLFTLLVGAGIGVTAGYYVSLALGQPDAGLVYMGVGAGIVAVALTVPVFFLFRPTMMIATALLGSVNLVTGGVAILLNYEQTYHPVVRYMTDWPLSPLIAILAIAGLGFTIQLAWWFRENESMSDDGNGQDWSNDTQPQFDQPY